MAFPLDVPNRNTAITEYNSYNEELKSSYHKHKQMFEELTQLTPPEKHYVQKNHLEEKLASINFDFWRHVNTIVTSYFDIIKLLQRKRDVENEINRIWCCKLSSTYEVPNQGNQEVGSESTSVWNNTGATSSLEQMPAATMSGLRIVPTFEDRVMRFKVASVFAGDLIKTIRRSVFAVRSDRVLPGSSNLKQLEKEAKWFRAHKRDLEKEIDRLEEHKKILSEKISYSPCEPKEGGNNNNNKMVSLRNLFKLFRVMNYS